ncbi:hypothetical protein PsYK624_041210 [Phanerochaete sordida]|uniref:Uncharacterized protein n=1 Tax=Phanerochaete sordida TaxID=48140 RepID=A0A9P3G2V6_9APHY|nr:hypothetical protein PsYK624_041210 [Phanerochaete sordida]
MKHIQAPLSVLEAHHWELPVDHLSDFPLFRDSLQTLDMTGVQLSSCKFQYPLVAALRVSGCEYAELRVFERCFPGLRDLSFETTMDEVVLGDDQPLDKVEDIRRFNLETSARDSWTSLRRVTSSINSLYALGIKCHAESLHLLHDTVNAADLCQKLQTILLDLRPTCLEVSLEIPDLSFLQLVAAMAPVARTLTRLKLHIDMHGHYFRDPSPKLRAQLIESLSTFPLQFLWLDLSWREVADHIPVPNEEDEGEGDDASPGPPTPAKPFTTLDRMALAEHASRALPALKHVCISTELLFQPVFETKMFFEVQHGEAGTKNTPRTITQLPWDARAKELRDSPPCHQVSDTDGYCIHCLYQRRSSRVNFLD